MSKVFDDVLAENIEDLKYLTDIFKSPTMNLVFIKVHLDFIDEGKFFKKLREFVGDFRIEAQDPYDVETRRVGVSFYTNKVEIKEGESRQVDLIAERVENGDWHFTRIEI